MKNRFSIVCCLLLLVAAPFARAQENDSFGTPNIGERLFLETRFSQFFFTNSGGNANYQLPQGDPVLSTAASIYGPLPGPFRGQAMNCRACHMVEELEVVGNRTYADYARRSPIPNINDGRTQTPRNAMPLVNSFLTRPTPFFLHFDGQFPTTQDLVIGTYTGRNFGWRPSEYNTALANLVSVIRNDDGTGALAQQYGGSSYAQAFAGGGQILPQYRILPAYRLFNVAVNDPTDPTYVSDAQIIHGVAALVESYLLTLVFSQDANGLFNGSPYDIFLIKNGLPRQPDTNESPVQYSQRLLQLVNSLPNPAFVADPDDGHFATHNQTFQFGPAELAGLKIFFTRGTSPGSAPVPGATGNCVACHAPPLFTDFLFHNNGAAQEEYDAIHGAGSFKALLIPGLAQRQTNYNAYLQPTPNHPDAAGTFLTPPTLAQPGQADLGVWNVYANPDLPGPQAGLQQILPLLIQPPAPQIATALLAGGIFALTGTTGSPGWPYSILATTNLALPRSSWQTVATNVFDSAGNFSFTTPVLAGAQSYFAIALGSPPPETALPQLIARFKTPNVRDLGSSEPYLHTGRLDTLEDVVNFYQTFSGLAAAGMVRNADPQLGLISLNADAVAPLAAFLRSLNEDYFDIPCPCN